MATPLPWFRLLFNRDPPKIRRRQALLGEFKVTKAQNLPFLQNLTFHSAGPRNHFCDGLLSRSQWSFRLKLAAKTSWDVVIESNQFLVSDPTTAVGGMNFHHEAWTSLSQRSEHQM